MFVKWMNEQMHQHKLPHNLTCLNVSFLIYNEKLFILPYGKNKKDHK